LTVAPDRFRARLVRFAAEECRGNSRLYEVVCNEMAADDALLEFVASALRQPSQPTLPLAAVHYLLLGGADGGGLERFYPNLTAAPEPPEQAYPAFRAFVLAHRQPLAELLATRGTQTNEVGRCSYLLPAYVIAAQRAKGPLAIVDVGSSAGLTLLFDRYAYDYGGATAGDARSAVRIRTEMRGAPAVTAPMPDVAERIGIDLSPVALDDGDAVRWLEACVWPEHIDRFANLRAAIAVARATPPRIVPGSAADRLPSVVAGIDRALALVIVNTAVMLYFPRDERARYAALLGEIGAQRETFWIANEHPAFLHEAGFGAALEMPDPSALPVAMTHWRNGNREARVLGWVGPHARWLDWLGAPDD